MISISGFQVFLLPTDFLQILIILEEIIWSIDPLLLP